MSNTNVLVLGHNGFIGKPLMDFFQIMKTPVTGLSTKEIDLTRWTVVPVLKSVINKETIVVFCSAMMPGRGGNTWKGFNDNLAMITNSVQAFSAGIKKLVFISTTGIYGDHAVNGVINEELIPNPQILYAWAKLVSEEICNAFSQQTETPLLILRPTIVYGPRNIHQRYNPTSFVLQMMKERLITLFGQGEDERDFIYVRDLAEIIGLTALDNVEGDYNVGSGVSHSFLHAAIKVAECFVGKETEVDIEYKPRQQPVSKHKYSIRKLMHLPVVCDFNFTSLSEGIRETVNFCRFKKEETDGGN